MNLPRWCSTTKIIVSFLNAELNATAMVVAHLKAERLRQLAGSTTGEARFTVNAKAATGWGKGTIMVWDFLGT